MGWGRFEDIPLKRARWGADDRGVNRVPYIQRYEGEEGHEMARKYVF